MKKHIPLGLIFLLTIMFIFTGCSQESSFNPLDQNKAINIAILGSNVETEFAGGLTGIKYAIENLKNQGINITYEIINDQGVYKDAVANAQKVATDSNYTLAFTMQNYNVIDTIVPSFENHKKPLIVLGGCYDSTMQKGYKYILNLVKSAQSIGQAMAQYAMKNNFKWVAGIHSKSKYEIKCIRGAQKVLEASKTVVFADTITGLTDTTDFDSVATRWQTLGVDLALVSEYDAMDALNVIKMIKSKFPDMKIISDQGIIIATIIKENSALEGVNVVWPYPYASSTQKSYISQISNLKDLDQNTINSIGPAFDLINMIYTNIKNAKTSTSFMENMKSENAYNGVCTIEFDASGALITNQPEYVVIKNYAIEHFN